MMKNRSYARKCLVLVLVLTALCLGAAPVKASPIAYNFYGTATGTLFAPDGQTVITDFFTPIPFLISIPGNTANVQSVEFDPVNFPGIFQWQNANLIGSISIPGVVTGTFPDLLTVWVDNGDPANFIPPQVGFDNALGSLFILAPDPPGGLDTYDLKCVFGPTALAGAFVSQFAAAMATTGNILAIDSAEGQFAAVPLPASVVLLGTGLLRLIGYRRSKRS
jgi:hypothetical protein